MAFRDGVNRVLNAAYTLDILTLFTPLTLLRLLMGQIGHTPSKTVITVTNIAVAAHDGLWKHTPLTQRTHLYTAYRANTAYTAYTYTTYEHIILF